MAMTGVIRWRPCSNRPASLPSPSFNSYFRTPRYFTANARITCNCLSHHHYKCQRLSEADIVANAFFAKQHRDYSSRFVNAYTSKGFSGQKSTKAAGFKQFSRLVTVHASQKNAVITSWMKQFISGLLKFTFGVCLFIVTLLASAPSFLTWSPGLNSALYLTNKVIPGKISVKSVSLGWTKNVIIEDVILQGTDGGTVLRIPNLETKSTLWSLVLGNAGFGDCIIDSPMIDLQEEKETGILRLSLAIMPKEKIKLIKKKSSGKKVHFPTVHVGMLLNIKAPNGDLKVLNGNILLPQDLAAVTGKKIHIDILLGHSAKQFIQEDGLGDIPRSLPLHFGLWSECMEAKATGFFDSRHMNIKLTRPVKIEVDLTPDVGRIHLKRINPLLGEILGPAVADEDMPDMVINISPEKMTLPADSYTVHIDPIKAVVARGPLVTGIFSLLSNGKRNAYMERDELQIETSPINARIGIGGEVTCSRIDLLISGKVHIATWGRMDWIEEIIDMILAISGTTLENTMGLSNLPKSYFLKIPIKGTLDKPQIDWKTASFEIIQLALQTKANPFVRGFLQQLRQEEDIPKPEYSLP